VPDPKRLLNILIRVLGFMFHAWDGFITDAPILKAVHIDLWKRHTWSSAPRLVVSPEERRFESDKPLELHQQIHSCHSLVVRIGGTSICAERWRKAGPHFQIVSFCSRFGALYSVSES
jgi:hypothetical protein